MDPLAPDPVQCAQANGPGVMSVDATEGGGAARREIYLRFDLAPETERTPLKGATLRLKTTKANLSKSNLSGELWSVETFTYESLSKRAPPRRGPGPIAPATGPIASDQVVEWKVPLDVVKAGPALCLSIATKSGDGVDYWNARGETPPVLVLEYE